MTATTEARRASVSRETLETKISVDLCLDGSGQSEFSTGVPFLEHMLDQIARHGMMDLKIIAHLSVCILALSKLLYGGILHSVIM